MAAEETVVDVSNMQQQMDDMISKVSESFNTQFTKAFNEQMDKLGDMSYAKMQSGDIAFKVGDTVYETDITTIGLTAVIGGAVGFIAYKAITTLL